MSQGTWTVRSPDPVRRQTRPTDRVRLGGRGGGGGCEGQEGPVRALVKMCPSDSVVLAANTSSISITGSRRRPGRAHRVVGMHFFNPVPLMQLAEVIPGIQTSPR